MLHLKEIRPGTKGTNRALRGIKSTGQEGEGMSPQQRERIEYLNDFLTDHITEHEQGVY